MERDNAGRYLGSYRGGRMSGWSGGMDNRRDNVDLPINTLRNAVNVDVLVSGKVRRRKGISPVIADTFAHSLFATKDYMLWANGMQLKMCTANLQASVLATSANFSSPLSYAALANEIYISNELGCGKVNELGIFEPWGITPPAAAPAAASMDAGSPKDREYQVTCTFVLADGEESGAPVGTKVFCGLHPIIFVTAIPQPLDPRVVAIRIYVSEVDGTMFYKYADLPVGMTQYYVYHPFNALGKKLESQHLMPLPAGQLIEQCNGRLYSARGNIVYFTEPLRYGLHDPLHGYYIFPERVTLLKGVDDGLFVSSDATYYIKGAPQPASKGSNVGLTPLFPYKAIEGAACNVPKSTDVMWVSERGIIVGKSDGTAQNVTEDRLAMDVYAGRACMGPVERDGFQGMLVIARDSVLSPFVSDDFIEAEAQRSAEVR